MTVKEDENDYEDEGEDVCEETEGPMETIYDDDEGKGRKLNAEQMTETILMLILMLIHNFHIRNARC